MPNWCANLLEIAGSVKQKKGFLEDAHSKEDDVEYDEKPSVLSLKSLIPYEGGEWDYDWCVKNWGTKWDINAELCNPNWEVENSNIIIKFESAWAPPEEAIKRIAEQYPYLGFSLIYAEPGMGFTGSVQYNIDYDSMDFIATNRGNVADILYGYIMGYDE
jgi:hypothetical protein